MIELKKLVVGYCFWFGKVIIREDLTNKFNEIA